MRWLALLLLLSPSISYGVSINNSEAVSASIEDPDSFRFFYIGHAYGAHNEEGGKKKLAYPHPEIIRLIDQLKIYDFGVFGGDVVEICNKQSVKAFEDFLVKPLGLPLINSIGNHDKCLQKMYGLPALQLITKEKNTFLIINSKYRKLENKKIDWLREQLEELNRKPDVIRIFIFTHRPTFLLLDPSLKGATGFGNFSVRPDEYFTDAIKKTILEIDTNKSVYWFAGDLGMRLPYVYKKLGKNIHLIGSGVYERGSDHYLDVTINPDTVDIKTVNFLSGNKSELIEYTNPEFIANQFLPGEAFDEGWAETMLTKLYTSVGAGKRIAIKAEKLEHDTSKAFDFYYLPESNSILLSKENCGPSGDYIFYVQFHPTHVENRRVRGRPWNGYHFYAARTAKNDKKCIATFPLPDYPYKFILTGQRNDDGRVWNARINPSELTIE
jgi:hypothetical protein